MRPAKTHIDFRQNPTPFSLKCSAVSDASPVADVSATVRREFWNIVESMESSVLRGVSPSEVANFKSAIEADKAGYIPIPTEDLALFNAAYLRRNLLKFLIVLDRFGARLEPKPFIDFGAGAGVAGAAWLRMSQIDSVDMRSSIHFDRSSSQLVTGKAAYRALTSSTELPRFTTQLDPAAVSDGSPISLFSFCICELMAGGTTPRNILGYVGDELIAVDFWETLLDFISGIGNELNSILLVHEEYNLGSDLAKALGQRTLKVSGLYAKRVR